MNNYIKANLEDLKGYLEFIMNEGKVTQVFFVANGKEYLIKQEGTYTENLSILVKECPQQYRVVATIDIDSHSFTREEVFSDINEAKRHKQSLEDTFAYMENVKEFKVEIIKEDATD